MGLLCDGVKCKQRERKRPWAVMIKPLHRVSSIKNLPRLAHFSHQKKRNVHKWVNQYPSVRRSPTNLNPVVQHRRSPFPPGKKPKAELISPEIESSNIIHTKKSKEKEKYIIQKEMCL